MQVQTGFAFATACLAAGIWLLLRQPISHFTEVTEPWDVWGGGFLVLVALALVIAIPIYSSAAQVGYELRQNPPGLYAGTRLNLNLSGAQSVRVNAESLLNGDAMRTWGVSIRDMSNHLLPLLEFSDEADAKRVAEEIAAFLGVPATM
jgi:hypothetical protein